MAITPLHSLQPTGEDLFRVPKPQSLREAEVEVGSVRENGNSSRKGVARKVLVPAREVLVSMSAPPPEAASSQPFNLRVSPIGEEKKPAEVAKPFKSLPEEEQEAIVDGFLRSVPSKSTLSTEVRR